MSDKTTNLPQLSPSQGNYEVRINEQFDAASPAMAFGRNAALCVGRNFALFGAQHWGTYEVANTTLLLDENDTSYIVANRDSGVISASTSTTNWNDSEVYGRLYLCTTDTYGVTDYEDHRGGPLGILGGSGSGGGGGGTAGTLDFDTDGTLAANSDAKIATQKATRTYVDAKLAGLSWKQAVRVATTGNGTLAGAYENGDTVDGVTLATGDRILIKNQSSASENGIYTVSASGAPTRATDADSGAELVNASVYVSEGTANADTQWTCTTNAPITVGSTSLAFAQLASGTAFTGGTLSSALNEAPAATLASAGTVNIGAAAANTVNITGTTTITAFDSIADGARRTLVFGGILTLTHNGTSLILPTGANITTAAGDTAEFLSLGSGNWRCVRYARASGAALSGGGGGGGSTQGKHSIPVLAGAMTPSTSGGCSPLSTIVTSANQPDLQSLGFDPTAEQYAQFSIAMPKKWNEGTVTAKFIWTHPSTSTNFGVVWGIQAVACGDGDAVGAAYGTAQTVADGGGTADTVYISGETSAMTVAGTPQAEDVVFFRVYRKAADGGDTMIVNARLHAVVVYITTDADTDA